MVDVNQHDLFNLSRFLKAQKDMYASALSELSIGQKRNHWMWFIFPQIDGLGTSETTKYYAVKSLKEAHKYLKHPILGTRLLECTKHVNAIQWRTAHQIFGVPDDMKFCSSMTLFEHIAGPNTDFSYALDKYFAGARDSKTLQLIQKLIQ